MRYAHSQGRSEARADYLDLCGEPQFFDDALLSFDREAREAGVLACHAAAFDCVPAELGAALAEKKLLKKTRPVLVWKLFIRCRMFRVLMLQLGTLQLMAFMQLQVVNSPSLEVK